MMLAKILSTLTIIGVFTPPIASKAPSKNPLDAPSKGAIDYCHVFGGIFLVDDRKQADYTVFITETEVFADVVVFEEDNILMADDPGLWYFTQDKGQAQFYIEITKEESKADFIIHKTDNPAYAGCLEN